MSAAPRGATLFVDGVRAGVVSPRSSGIGTSYKGWYFVAGWDVPAVKHKNTCDAMVATIDDAKAACEAYVRSCLGLS